MQATIEISMYPLNENYKEIVLAFIANISQIKDIEVVTNGMSTQIFGDYEVIISILSKEMKEVFEHYPTVFLLKIGRGILKYGE